VCTVCASWKKCAPDLFASTKKPGKLFSQLNSATELVADGWCGGCWLSEFWPCCSSEVLQDDIYYFLVLGAAAVAAESKSIITAHPPLSFIGPFTDVTPQRRTQLYTRSVLLRRDAADYTTSINYPNALLSFTTLTKKLMEWPEIMYWLKYIPKFTRI